MTTEVPNRKAVLALVQRFEKWSEDSRIKPEDKDVWEPESESDDAGRYDGMTPEQVKAAKEARRQEKINERIEQKTRAAAGVTPKRIGGQSKQTDAGDGDTQDVEAYWDEETQTYWYTDEATGEQYYWDEESQDYVLYEEEAEEGAEDDKVFAANDSDTLAQLAVTIGVAREYLATYEKGVPAYAFVKANGGMLKAMQLFVRADRGKIYIVRHNKSQYVHVQHFEEAAKKKGSIEALEASVSDPVMKETIQTLAQQPYIIFWTNDTYLAATKKKKTLRMPKAMKAMLGKNKNKKRKSIVFVFDEFEQRDMLFDIVQGMAKMHKCQLEMAA